MKNRWKWEEAGVKKGIIRRAGSWKQAEVFEFAECLHPEHNQTRVTTWYKKMNDKWSEPKRQREEKCSQAAFNWSFC